MTLECNWVSWMQQGRNSFFNNLILRNMTNAWLIGTCLENNNDIFVDNIQKENYLNFFGLLSFKAS